jgi:energy-coupling factor transporter ATP-binding protein EcfA2
MPNLPRHLRIFLSSPGDVADERALALRVLEQLPTDPLLRGRVTFEAIAWDKPGASAPLLANMTPQEAINQGLPKPSECDIVVVIFWSRMGTPLPPEYVKADGARYLSGTEWEYEDAMQGARKANSPQILVYRRSEEPIIGLRDPERNLKIEQWERVETFFSAFTNPDGSIRQGFNVYKQPDEFREQFENHMKSLVARILESPAKTKAKTTSAKKAKKTELWKGSPFPGLRAFKEEDAPIYFGRGREVDELIRKITTSRFVAVVGASGSGKSSLVGAGLIPRLKGSAIEGSQSWQLLDVKPTLLRSHRSFDFKLGDTQGYLSRNQRAAIRAVQSLREVSPDNLLEVIKSLSSNAQQPILFVVDQFEELFTIVAAEYRQRFIDILVEAVTNPDSNNRVVITLRADFYAKCLEYPELAELLRTGSFPMSAPGPGSLYQMITRPAALAGLEFEDGLPERILDDTGTDPGALPLMAYALDELYHACEKAKRLSHAAYEAFGGVQGAIGTRAESVFNALPTETQATLPDVFRHLVEVDERGIPTRKRASLNDLSNDAIQLAEALTNARLLTKASGENNQPVIEVAHEALLRSWPRLAGWIEMVRDDLYMLRMVRTAADDWARSGRQRTFLWPHERLKLIYDVLDRLNHPPLDEITRTFIRPESEWLIEEIEDPTTPHIRRSAIGDRLAEIGDPRPGVGVRADGVPDIDWCKVPGGTVILEKDGGTFKVKPFYISRYPVTYAQYRAFIEAEDGYYDKRWWEGLVKRKDETPPGQQRFPIGNHPVENVSWNDAVAFCRWLSAKLGYEIRLPMEYEWQQAATGGKSDHVYPWGPEWDSERANTTKGDLYRTTSVGMYPHGASPVGAMDMSGNVKEWCLNEFNAPGKIAYHTEKLRRTVRGGSYVHGTDFARSATRNDTNIGGRNEYTGFRVVCTKPK